MASAAKAWGVGVNWYVNRYAKLSSNLERAQFEHMVTNGKLRGETTVMSRLQLSF